MDGASSPRRLAPRIGAQVVAAIVLHFLAALLLDRTAGPGLAELLDVPLPTGGGVPAALAGWAVPSALPLALWATLVLGRALALRQGDSAFWFVGAAVLVAVAVFPVALLQWMFASKQMAVADVLAAWLIAPAAAAVAAVAHGARRQAEGAGAEGR